MLRKCPSGINKGVVVLVWATTLPIYRGRGGVGHVARGDSEEDMIRAVIVMNTQGKPRLTKFYDYMVPLSLLFEWNSQSKDSISSILFLIVFEFDFVRSASGEAARTHSARLWRSLLSLISDWSWISLYIKLDVLLHSSISISFKDLSVLWLWFFLFLF